MKFRFLWITDPWDTLDHAKDTTLRLAAEAVRLGHRSDWCDVRTIRVEKGHAWVDAYAMDSAGNPSGKLKVVDPSHFDQIHYRVDPPVDLAYVQPLQTLLTCVPDSKLVNPPELLVGASEKLEPFLLRKPSLFPETFVGSALDSLLAFGARERRVVLKPLHDAQSKGVELLDFRTPRGRAHARKLLARATHEGVLPVILQRYLPGIERGETRLWFIDGKLLAHATKLPLEGDFRVQIDRGSRLDLRPLAARERKAARIIGAHLRKRKIRLAAVDLIEGRVTDLNFTSPGLLVQMEALHGRNLAQAIIQALATGNRT